MNKKGFTLIELLVVIAIIALLLSIIMPGLRLAKEQARKVVCNANLSQLGKGVEMYEMDYEYKRFSMRNDNSPLETELYWMGKIAAYVGNEHYGSQFTEGQKIDLLLCPSAPYSKYEDLPGSSLVVPGTGQVGTNKMPWSWKRGTGMSTIGSYGINGHLAYDDMYASSPTLAPKAFGNWNNVPGYTPLFFCSRWTVMWADDSFYDPPANLQGDHFPVTGSLDWACIDRHNRNVNVLLKDISSSSVALEDLWTLRWYKDYTPPANPVNLPRQ